MGEIDSRAPFESVKAAVSLFNGPALSKNRITVSKPNGPPPNPVTQEQRDLLEAQFHQAQRQLKGFQEKLKNAEITRIQALSELQQAKNLANDLTDELKASELRNLRKSEERETVVTSGFDGIRDMLQKIAEEEKSLKDQMESLVLELENVKTEKVNLKLKEAESEALVSELKVKIQSLKVDLEGIISKGPTTQTTCKNLISTFQLLTLESETVRKKSDTVKKILDELAKEAEAVKLTFLPDKSQTFRAELGCGTQKPLKFETLAEVKVDAVLTRVEAIGASEKEGIARLEAMKREMEEMNLERENALKRVQTSEAARRAAEGELKRLREEDIRRANELSKAPSPPRTRLRRPDPPDCRKSFKKSGKVSTKQTALLLKVNGLFHKKGGQLNRGSHSYLPGEK